MIIDTKMYMVTFVCSVLSIFLLSILYMVVAYNYDWFSRWCGCSSRRRRVGCDRCSPTIATVSGNADLESQYSEPPEYNKVGSPPPYDLVMAGNPPPYSEAIQRAESIPVTPTSPIFPTLPMTHGSLSTQESNIQEQTQNAEVPQENSRLGLASVLLDSQTENLTSIHVIPTFTFPSGEVTNIISSSDTCSTSHLNNNNS